MLVSCYSIKHWHTQDLGLFNNPDKEAISSYPDYYFRHDSIVVEILNDGSILILSSHNLLQTFQGAPFHIKEPLWRISWCHHEVCLSRFYNWTVNMVSLNKLNSVFWRWFGDF